MSPKDSVNLQTYSTLPDQTYLKINMYSICRKYEENKKTPAKASEESSHYDNRQSNTTTNSHRADLNRRPLPYHGSALPTELRWQRVGKNHDHYLGMSRQNATVLHKTKTSLYQWYYKNTQSMLRFTPCCNIRTYLFLLKSIVGSPLQKTHKA